LEGNRTLATPDNPVDGKRITLRSKASGANRTLTLPSIFRFGTEITEISTTVQDTTDYIGAMYNGNDSKWDVIAYVQNYAL